MLTFARIIFNPLSMLAMGMFVAVTVAFAADIPTDRVSAAATTMKRLYGDAQSPLSDTDPEFAAVRDRLVYGQIYCRGTLTAEQRHLVTMVSQAAIGSDVNVARTADGALRDGVSPLALREAIYQVTPYVGMARAEAALKALNGVFMKSNVQLPLSEQGTVTEDSRFSDGLAIQTEIFGEVIANMHKNTPDGQKDIVVDYLSAWCFGDTYTRKVLDVKQRELLTFVAIVSLGGCESQAKSHVQANIKVGNPTQLLVDALAQCLPWIGFPRTLNALACVNAVSQ